ncbi:hypothetical protein EYF80_015709 [Liparis tanakae]|uniref:Uncharacterized protein n=1 Tax=Liparis tanakae TaxID=230148 RepID=A0A4Z2I801_9TELE|nr:hypothetical protein EYF80_015709 [Liparis tanakae]
MSADKSRTDVCLFSEQLSDEKEGVNERRPLLRVRGGPLRPPSPQKIAGDFDLVLQGRGSPTPSPVFSKPKISSASSPDAFFSELVHSAVTHVIRRARLLSPKSRLEEPIKTLSGLLGWRTQDHLQQQLQQSSFCRLFRDTSVQLRMEIM